MKWAMGLLPMGLGLFHQFLIELGYSTSFLESYLDDFLTVPIILGLLDTLTLLLKQPLAKNQKARLAIGGVIWFSILFEIILPRYYDELTADYFDLLAYTSGALAYYYVSNAFVTPIPNNA